MNKQHQKALKLLGWTILVLFAAPKINVRVGPVPVYLIDGLLFLTAWFAFKLPAPKHKIPYRGAILLFLVLIILNEFTNGLALGTLLQPAYLMVRYVLAISLFFSVSRIVRSHDDIFRLLNYVLVGSLVTSTLLIMTSLPGTRALVNSTLFSISYLMPNSEALSETLSATDQAMRGTSLIGVSILSGAFLNVAWPLLLYTFVKKERIKKRNTLTYIALFLAPIAIVMTYSRGAILALTLVVLGILWFQKGKIRRVILFAVVSAALLFQFVGWDSEYFFFERIEKRVTEGFENPLEDKRETERIFAYIDPFVHLTNNPGGLFLGEGLAREKIQSDERKSIAYVNTADHAVFAKTYYAYGMIAAFLIFIVFLGMLKFTYTKIRKYAHIFYFSGQYSKILFAILMGFSSWFFFGHAAVSTPRGCMLMFLVFGLVVSQNNLLRSEHKRVKKPTERLI